MEHILIDGVQRPQIPVKDWGTQKMDLRDKGVLAVIHVAEVHLRSNGGLDDGPSLAFILDRPGLRLVSEITIYTLNDTLSKLGYQVIPLKPKT